MNSIFESQNIISGFIIGIKFYFKISGSVTNIFTHEKNELKVQAQWTDKNYKYHLKIVSDTETGKPMISLYNIS